MTVNEAGASPVVLVCDHASKAVPVALGTLGLSEAELDRHIGWDGGAGAVTLGLAGRLDCAAVLSGYSRLVIDCNRRLDHETSVPTESDGTPVPGNIGLSEEDRERRRHGVFEPYHAAIARRLDAVRHRGLDPALIAIHSFTPVMDGFARPWHVAVLWDDDPRIPAPLLAALEHRGDLVVGDNVPYSGKEHYGYTMEVHAGTAGIPHALIEIRADQIETPDGVERIVDILAEALGGVFAALGLVAQRRV